MERKGKGQTVVFIELLLLAKFESRESVVTEAVSVISPVAVGFTVKVMVAEPLVLMLPRAPRTGLLLVFNEPCEVDADLSVTVDGSVSVRLTFKAETGPLLVTITV